MIIDKFIYDGFDSYGPEIIEKYSYHFEDVYCKVFLDDDYVCLIGPIPKDYNKKWIHHDYMTNNSWFDNIPKKWI